MWRDKINLKKLCLNFFHYRLHKLPSDAAFADVGEGFVKREPLNGIDFFREREIFLLDGCLKAEHQHFLLLVWVTLDEFKCLDILADFLFDLTDGCFLSGLTELHDAGDTHVFGLGNVVLAEQRDLVIFVHNGRDDAGREHVPKRNVATFAKRNDSFVANFMADQLGSAVRTVCKMHD